MGFIILPLFPGTPLVVKSSLPFDYPAGWFVYDANNPFPYPFMVFEDIRLLEQGFVLDRDVQTLEQQDDFSLSFFYYAILQQPQTGDLEPNPAALLLESITNTANTDYIQKGILQLSDHQWIYAEYIIPSYNPDLLRVFYGISLLEDKMLLVAYLLPFDDEADSAALFSRVLASAKLEN